MSVLKRYNGSSWEPIGPAIVNTGGGSEGCVRFDEEQNLTSDEKALARQNIEAVESIDAQIESSLTIQNTGETAITIECDTSGASPSIQDILLFEGENSNAVILRNISNPTGIKDAANKTYVDELVPTNAAIDSSGLISFKNSSGTTLFTLQLPLYNGGTQ